VAGTEAAVLMVESEANELPEEVMLGAVVFGHTQQQAVIEMIHALVEEGGKPLWDWQPPAKDEALSREVRRADRGDLRAALPDPQQAERSQARLKEIAQKIDSRSRPADAARPERHIHNVRSSSKRRSCATRSSPASRASTAATRAPCARSASAPACCRARTARRCSRAARRRRSSSRPSAPRATSRSSTR
jgi:hypothetical protein